MHDESGNFKTDRYFTTGFLYIPEHFAHEAVQRLRLARQQNGYWREVHYKRLRGDGSKDRTALAWLELVQEWMTEGRAATYVLSVDTHHPRFDHARFRRRHFGYNRFTRMAVVSLFVPGGRDQWPERIPLAVDPEVADHQGSLFET